MSSSCVQGKHGDLPKFGDDRFGKRGKKQIAWDLTTDDDGQQKAPALPDAITV